MRGPLVATVLLAAACSASKAPGPPEALIPSTPSAPPRVDSAPPATASTPAASQTTPAAPPAPVDVPAACRGAAIDLDALLELADCDLKFGEDHFSAPVSVLALAAKAKPVAPGGSTEVVLTVTNTSRERQVFDMNVSCVNVAFEVMALDAAGNRADTIVDPGCGFGMGCGHRGVRVALEPGGVMTKKLSFYAQVTRLGAKCARLPDVPMKRGTYTLRISTPVRDPELAGTGMSSGRTVETPLVVK